MDKYQKIKLSIVSGLLLLNIGVVGYQVNNWSKAYDKIEIKEIKNFNTIWSDIWDTNTQTFKPNINPNIIQALEYTAETPEQKQKFLLAKSSIPLINVSTHNSNLSDFISAANNYYQFKDTDNNHKEQQKQNETILKLIEDLINQINYDSIHIHIDSDKITFDKSIQENIELKLINTSLPWTEKELFNTHITELNNVIQSQINENQLRASQEEIISFKPKVEEFLQKAKEYQERIESEYVNVSELKNIIQTFDNMDVTSKRQWFTTLSEIKETTLTTTYDTQLTNQFFIDNPTLEKHKDWLQSLTLTVNLNRKASTTYSQSDVYKKETIISDIITSPNQNDYDLINKNSLSNLNWQLNQKQDVKIYIERPTTSTDSSTSSSSNNQTTTIPSSTRRSSNP